MRVCATQLPPLLHTIKLRLAGLQPRDKLRIALGVEKFHQFSSTAWYQACDRCRASLVCTSERGCNQVASYLLKRLRGPGRKLRRAGRRLSSPVAPASTSRQGQACIMAWTQTHQRLHVLQRGREQLVAMPAPLRLPLCCRLPATSLPRVWATARRVSAQLSPQASGRARPCETAGVSKQHALRRGKRVAIGRRIRCARQERRVSGGHTHAARIATHPHTWCPVGGQGQRLV
jgi:hypothetical protein